MTLRADTRRTDSTHPSPKDSTTRWLRIGIPVLLVLIWLVGGSIGVAARGMGCSGSV